MKQTTNRTRTCILTVGAVAVVASLGLSACSSGNSDEDNGGNKAAAETRKQLTNQQDQVNKEVDAIRSEVEKKVEAAKKKIAKRTGGLKVEGGSGGTIPPEMKKKLEQLQKRVAKEGKQAGKDSQTKKPPVKESP